MAAETLNGSQTAVVGGGEHVLATRSSAGVYGFLIDLVNMAAGDVAVLRMKCKARSVDSTRRLLYPPAVYKDVQTVPIVTFPPAMVADAEWSLEQTAGTGRAFTWSLLTA